jgi:outer membrane lipoprotein LolB
MSKLSTLPLLAVGWLLLILAGCSQTPLPTMLNVAQHQLSLQQLQHWQIKGRFAFISKKEKVSAYLNWHQSNQIIQLSLNSLLGTNLVTLNSQPGLSELIAEDKLYRDTEASRLVEQVTGWTIPVEQLIQWIKGQQTDQVVPHYSDNGTLASLTTRCQSCDVWNIRYNDYRKVGKYWLPHNVELDRQKSENIRLKIKISEWILN